MPEITFKNAIVKKYSRLFVLKYLDKTNKKLKNDLAK
jgi:hypothetical protein